MLGTLADPILPIAQLIYGAEAATPTTGAIVVDVTLLFCGTIFLMDMLDKGWSSSGKILTMVSKNPALLALAVGPCSAMPFVIALQYGVRTEAMTKAILISTFLTLISLAVLTS